MRRMVVVTPALALLPVLRRAFGGAGTPRREGLPGIGSADRSCALAGELLGATLSALGVDGKTARAELPADPRGDIAVLPAPARLIPSEVAKAFREDVTVAKSCVSTRR